MRRSLFFACLALLACQPPGSAGIRVGSKAFTESVILGELTTQFLLTEGTHAVHRRELGGTRILWEALRANQLDVYPEYTGTLRRELLEGNSNSTNEELNSFLAQQHLRMTAPLGFSNNYAIGMRRSQAEALQIQTLTDLAKHPELKLAFSNEFMDRADGWRALQTAYGLRNRARGLDHDLAYRALTDAQIDATDLYSTDPEIKAGDLRILEDDRHHFPDYEAVLLYRDDLAAEAESRLKLLAGAVNRTEMMTLNAEVKLQHQPDSAVAAAFLASHFGLHPTARSTGVLTRIYARTIEHLVLVSISLFFALLVALPLGIAAAKQRRLGQVLLSATSVLQTIPSLALLVFLIPLLGIGTVPAIVALFLYSLLPILRGAYTGIVGISPELEDSAEALGLSSRAKLFQIELPLAAPSILAGIKTAAVINVGTATLGALIGAGGYGQSIFTGVRLADSGLILEGAIPAAVMALLIQKLFDLVESRFAPQL